MAAFAHPSVVVLGGGGALGEAWMSAVLAGLAEVADFDARECEAWVGTSAGSIVAAVLSAGVDPRERLGELPEPPAAPDEPPGAGPLRRALEIGVAAGGVLAGPLATIGLRATETGGALARRVALARVPAGRRSPDGLGRRLESAGARWDGRLSISAVEVETGRRVMFGTPGAPEVPVGTAVEASCAIPGVFRPIALNGRRYVDGGAWSPTNLDRAPAGRGTLVLCLNPTGSLRGARGAVGVLSRSLAAVEALVLERRGARVRIVSPDAASLSAIGPSLMDSRPRADVIAAGVAQGHALARGD